MKTIDTDLEGTCRNERTDKTYTREGAHRHKIFMSKICIKIY